MTKVVTKELEADVFEYLNAPDTDKELLSRFLALSDYDRSCVAAAITALENSGGCTSPDEEFLTSVLADYGSRTLNPDNVQDSLAEYRENMDHMERWISHFAHRHPVKVGKLVTKALKTTPAANAK